MGKLHHILGASTAVAAAGLTILPAAAPAAGATRCGGADLPAVASAPAAVRAAVTCLVNQQRTTRHLPGLRDDPRLDRSAQSWSDRMVATQTFTHGSDFAARITAAGFSWQIAGENIATGFATAAEVVSGWMASPGHCRNILDPQFGAVGTGMNVRPTDGIASGATWTEDFGLAVSQSAPSRDWGPAKRCPY